MVFVLFFRPTAHYFAKCDQPYVTMLIILISGLAAASGVHVGKVLHSNVVCAHVIHHIAESMKSKAITGMQQKEQNLTNISVLLIDENTTLSHKSAFYKLDFPSTRRVLWQIKCTKFIFGRGSTPDPTGGADDTPPQLLRG